MQKNKGVVLSLPERITIDRCGVLKANLEKILDKYKALMLDFRKVQEIDLAGMQVLTSFLLDCVSSKLEVGCLGPLSPRVNKSFETGGLLHSKNDGDYLFPFLYDKGVKVELS